MSNSAFPIDVAEAGTYTPATLVGKRRDSNMPTYEYECTDCGHRFEKFQVISAPVLKRCPKCRHKLRRLIGTGAGLIFKGSGFYSTDYRSDNYKSSQKAEKMQPEKKGAAPEASKPAAKKDAAPKSSGSSTK